MFIIAMPENFAHSELEASLWGSRAVIEWASYNEAIMSAYYCMSQFSQSDILEKHTMLVIL